MKVAFFHDSILKHDTLNDAYYTSGGLTYSYLKRYLKYFESVLMVTRSEKMKKNDDKSKLSVSSGEGILFNCINGSSVKALLGKAVKKKVADAMKKTDFAIIRLPSMVGIIACEECNRLKKPYLVEVVGSPFCALWYYGKFSYKMVAPLYAAVNRHLIKKAKNVIYVTQEYLQRGYPNRHNNVGISDVNIGEVDESVLEKRLKKIQSYNDKTVYKIGLIGSMDVKYKGHDIAIKSVPLLKRNGVSVEMHFLGKCSDKSRERLINVATKHGVGNSIFIDGVLPGGKAVYEWIDDKDFIILPSKQEGLPRSIVEAMSRAGVCVGSKTGGIPELLESNCIMKKNIATCLSEIIVRFVNNKSEMQKNASRNYEFCKYFSIGELNLKRDKFFREAINDLCKKKVNVLNIAGGLDVGGAETMMLNILRSIDRETFQLFYLCYSEKEYDYEEEVRKLGGIVLHTKKSGMFDNIMKVRKAIKDNNIDVIHCHTHYNSAFAIIAAKMTGVKTIITHSHTTQNVIERSLIEKLYHRLSRSIINKYSNYLFACGEKAADALFDDRDKIVMIGNGIVLSDFEYSIKNRNKIRRELGIKQDTVVIGHVGRFAKPKNHEFLIDIFADYHKLDKDAVLVLIGEGSLLTSIKKKAKNLKIDSNVKFLGLRMDTNVIYSIMDVMVFPSLFEGMPVSLIEAQMNGLPIVASDVIDSKINVSGKIRFLPLGNNATEWAKLAKELVGSRYDCSDYLYGGDYDMAKEVKKIEGYYAS